MKKCESSKKCGTIRLGQEYVQDYGPNTNDDKGKGITAPMDYADLTLDEEDDPLPPKFKFLNMKKYSRIDDPHLYLK